MSRSLRNAAPRAPPAFRIWRGPRASGHLFRSAAFDLSLHALHGQLAPALALPPPRGATFGFVTRGRLRVESDPPAAAWTLSAGQHWACAAGARVRAAGPDARALVVQKAGFAALHAAGGPAERAGRLRYIDGCTDTVLVPPPRRGDPCLNLLHFPPRVVQSAHTHPSVRVGVVLSGSGRCVLGGGEPPVPLEEGAVFVIPHDVLHSFETGEEELRVVAFHPDSDCGPTDEDHPMRNQTILPGEERRRAIG